MAYGAQGTGISQPSAQLVGTMNALTEKFIEPSLADNVFKPSSAFWGMMRKGQKKQGGELVYGLITQEEMSGGAYYGDQLLDSQVVDSVAPANQLWRFYRQSCSIPVTDQVLNGGPEGVLNITDEKVQISAGSMLQKLCRALFHVAPQNTVLDVDDLMAWVDTQNNVIAGIDRNAAGNGYWNPPTPVNVAGALTAAIAEGGYQKVVFGYDEPDLLIIEQTKYKSFKQAFTTNIRYEGNIQDEEAVQAGFRYHFLFNNAVVIPDLFIPSQKALLLNTNYIYPVWHKNDYFNMTPWMMPTNQRVVVSHIFTTWQIMNKGPRMSIAFDSITS